MQPIKLESTRILTDYAQKPFRTLIHVPHKVGDDHIRRLPH